MKPLTEDELKFLETYPHSTPLERAAAAEIRALRAALETEQQKWLEAIRKSLSATAPDRLKTELLQERARPSSWERQANIEMEVHEETKAERDRLAEERDFYRTGVENLEGSLFNMTTARDRLKATVELLNANAETYKSLAGELEQARAECAALRERLKKYEP